VGAYNEAVGSFERRVIPQVRRIEEAGAASEREVLAPDALQSAARAVTARQEAAGEEERAPAARASHLRPLADPSAPALPIPAAEPERALG
jgi:hypothetical protein